MTWLTDAWAAVSRQECPAEILEAMEEWLLDRDVRIGVDYQAKFARENKAIKQREKEAKQERNRLCPKYTGRIRQCMVSVQPGRGAPGRCHQDAKKVNVVAGLYHDGYVASDGSKHRAIVVCAGHAYDLRPYPYTGWGGDPNPRIPTIEPEAEAAALAVLG